jgi:hypothetical protein
MVRIPIHPKDTTFIRLMKGAAKALRTGNKKLLKKVKKEFSEDNISLFYNQETDALRVLKQGAPPIDFPVSDWTKLLKK